MPLKEDFITAEEYYHTLFHELVHSTGHSTRVGRNINHQMGIHNY